MSFFRRRKQNTKSVDNRRRERGQTNPPNRKKNEKKTESKLPKEGANTKTSETLKAFSWKPIFLAVGKFAFAVTCIGLIVMGGIFAYKHATTSDYFSVENIKIVGNKKLDASEVMTSGGLKTGMNIFEIVAEKVQQDIITHPWIKEAKVVKRLPSTLSVEILERKPECLVMLDVAYIVDEEGDIFKRWTFQDPIVMPIISGISRQQFINDKEEVTEIVQDAISLIRRYRKAGLDRIAKLHEVHREVDGGFSFTIGKEPFYVRFGKGPYRKKIVQLVKLFKQMKADGKKPAIVYFDNEVRPDRVTVKLRKTDDLAKPKEFHQ